MSEEEEGEKQSYDITQKYTHISRYFLHIKNLWLVQKWQLGFCQNRNWWDPFYSNDYAEKSTRGKEKCWKSSRSAEDVVSNHHGHHTITKTSSHTDLPQVTETKKEQSLTQWHSLWMKMWKKQSKEGKKIICAVQKGIQEWRSRAFIQLILPSK